MLFIRNNKKQGRAYQLRAGDKGIIVSFVFAAFHQNNNGSWIMTQGVFSIYRSDMASDGDGVESLTERQEHEIQFLEAIYMDDVKDLRKNDAWKVSR